MRFGIAAAIAQTVLAVCFAPLASAEEKAQPASTYVAPVPGAQPGKPNESDLKEHGHYINKDGAVVHSPAHSVSGTAPNGASAQCRDGSYSFSQHRSGTCSHHGGVSKWIGG